MKPSSIDSIKVFGGMNLGSPEVNVHRVNSPVTHINVFRQESKESRSLRNAERGEIKLVSTELYFPPVWFWSMGFGVKSSRIKK